MFMGIKLKQRKNNTRREFLLTFFNKKFEYQFKEVNGFILQKRINGSTHKLEVAIYSKKSWRKMNNLESNQENLI